MMLDQMDTSIDFHNFHEEYLNDMVAVVNSIIPARFTNYKKKEKILDESFEKLEKVLDLYAGDKTKPKTEKVEIFNSLISIEKERYRRPIGKPLIPSKGKTFDVICFIGPDDYRGTISKIEPALNHHTEPYFFKCISKINRNEIMENINYYAPDVLIFVMHGEQEQIKLEDGFISDTIFFNMFENEIKKKNKTLPQLVIFFVCHSSGIANSFAKRFNIPTIGYEGTPTSSQAIKCYEILMQNLIIKRKSINKSFAKTLKTLESHSESNIRKTVDLIKLYPVY